MRYGTRHVEVGRNDSVLDWDCSDQLQHLSSERCDQPHWVSVVDSGGIPAKGYALVFGGGSCSWDLFIRLHSLALKRGSR